MEVENIIGLIFDGNYEASELRRHVKRVHVCKQAMDDSRDEKLAAESFTKKTGGGEVGHQYPRQCCTGRTLWRFQGDRWR